MEANQVINLHVPAILYHVLKYHKRQIKQVLWNYNCCHSALLGPSIHSLVTLKPSGNTIKMQPIGLEPLGSWHRVAQQICMHALGWCHEAVQWWATQEYGLQLLPWTTSWMASLFKTHQSPADDITWYVGWVQILARHLLPTVQRWEKYSIPPCLPSLVGKMENHSCLPIRELLWISHLQCALDIRESALPGVLSRKPPHQNHWQRDCSSARAPLGLLWTSEPERPLTQRMPSVPSQAWQAARAQTISATALSPKLLLKESLQWSPRNTFFDGKSHRHTSDFSLFFSYFPNVFIVDLWDGARKTWLSKSRPWDAGTQPCDVAIQCSWETHERQTQRGEKKEVKASHGLRQCSALSLVLVETPKHKLVCSVFRLGGKGSNQWLKTYPGANSHTFLVTGVVPQVLPFEEGIRRYLWKVLQGRRQELMKANELDGAPITVWLAYADFQISQVILSPLIHSFSGGYRELLFTRQYYI